MNIWVAPVARLDEARPLTASKDRPIRQSFWAPDSSMVMYIQDKGGDENFLLYGIDLQSGQERTLTPFSNTRVEIVNVSPLVKDRILIGLNNRDARWHDVHSLELKTGKLTEIIRAKSSTGLILLIAESMSRPIGNNPCLPFTSTCTCVLSSLNCVTFPISETDSNGASTVGAFSP